SSSDADPDLTAVVGADIDMDGDVDVVATDAQLRLYVWINDGAGHFTRREPARSTTWRDDGAQPRVNERSGTTDVSAPAARSSIHPPSSVYIPASIDSVSAVQPFTDAVDDADRSVNTPRAPPLALLID